MKGFGMGCVRKTVMPVKKFQGGRGGGIRNTVEAEEPFYVRPRGKRSLKSSPLKVPTTAKKRTITAGKGGKVIHPSVENLGVHRKRAPK